MELSHAHDIIRMGLQLQATEYDTKCEKGINHTGTVSQALVQ